MAATFPIKGRDMLLKRGASPVLIAGVRTKSISINGEPIDVSNDDDAAVRTLMAEPGQVTVEISVSGIAKDDTLLTESLSKTDRVDNTVFEWPGSTANGTLTGDFFLASYSESGEYMGAVTFDATLQSAGDVAYVAAT